MESLDKNVLKVIWDFIPNNLKFFAMLTCSSWYNGIRENYEKVSRSEIAIAVVTEHGYTNLLETQFSNGFYVHTYQKMIKEACNSGNFVLLKYLLERCEKQYGTATMRNYRFVVDRAAEEGDIEFLKYAKEKGLEWNSETSASAARGGQLETLKFLHENGCDWDEVVCSYASNNGNLEMLIYARENGCDWGDTCEGAARSGSMDCLFYAIENGCELNSKSACEAAMEGKQMEMVKYFYKIGVDWDADTCAKAAEVGFLEGLQFAHENGCDWDARTCHQAALGGCYQVTLGGHLECLIYAYENGCRWESEEEIFECAAMSNNIEIVKYVLGNGCQHQILQHGKHACAKAASVGAIDCLKFLHDNGCEWDFRTVSAAANNLFGPHLKCLKYAIENGCEWDKGEVFNEAVESGDLEFIKYSQEKGCKGNETLIKAAIYADDIHCLKYLRNSGCPWNEETLSTCSGLERMDCLVYLISNGCPMDERACINAISHNNMDNLEYLRKNGCPWGPDTFKAALGSRNEKIIKYVCDNGCPANEADYYNNYYYWNYPDLEKIVAKYLKIEIKQEQEQEQEQEQDNNEWEKQKEPT